MLPPPPRPGPKLPTDSDAAVRGTNDDATASKLSCVQRGYWPDAFLQYFVPRPLHQAPAIHRGYFARVTAMRQLLLRFLAAGVTPDEVPPAKQVLSLGAGFDTTFFQLAAAGIAPAVYAEVDFEEVVARKRAVIGQHEALYTLIERAPPGGRYALQAADLRRTQELDGAVSAAGLDTRVATLILLECVLAYLDPQDAASLLAWASRTFPSACVVTYDPTRPNDAFGRQMLLNLQARGCPFRSISAAPDPEHLVARLHACGWARAECADMNDVYTRVLEPASRRAAERLELLDEVEEWHLILGHYALAVGVNDAQGLLAGVTLAATRDAAD